MCEASRLEATGGSRERLIAHIGKGLRPRREVAVDHSQALLSQPAAASHSPPMLPRSPMKSLRVGRKELTAHLGLACPLSRSPYPAVVG